MTRIEGQLPDRKVLAQQVLSWITCAKRPLTTSELQHALAVELGKSSLDEDNLPEIEGMVSVCAGLVTVDEESEIIRLVHYTTQEYFERTRETWFPNRETEITKICVTYLSFNTFESGICYGEAFKERLLSNQLYSYASCNWGHHARESFTHIPEVHNFLKRNALVQASIQSLVLGKEEERYNLNHPGGLGGTTGLHLAAYFGLEEAVQHLLEFSIPDEKDDWNRTPLSWAAENGQEAIVKLLLVNSAEIDSHDRSFRTPLTSAVGMRHEAVVKLLLVNGADIDYEDEFGWTPLSWAVMSGHEVIVKILIENGAEINSKDDVGQTPLSWAAKTGQEAIFKLLVEKGADANLTDWHARAPLSYAAEHGHEAILKLLLVDNTDVNLKDTLSGMTPLIYAVESGNEAAVKLLLVNKAMVDLENNRGQTALSRAAENGHEAITILLLAYKAKVNIEDKYTRTPLLYAVKGKHEAVAKLLLEHHAKIDLRDTTYDRTPLSLATMKEDERVVRLLYRHGEGEMGS